MIRLRFVLVAALAAACATAPRAFTPPAGPYGAALGEATRYGQIYSGLNAVLFAWATAETPAFRRARAEELAKLFAVSPAEAERREAALTSAAEGPTFFVAVHTQDRTRNDLEQAHGAWALRLAGPGGTSAAPVKVKRFATITPAMKALHPYLDRYWVPYRVTFPAGSEGARTLVISGPGGRLDLEF